MVAAYGDGASEDAGVDALVQQTYSLPQLLTTVHPEKGMSNRVCQSLNNHSLLSLILIRHFSSSIIMFCSCEHPENCS